MKILFGKFAHEANTFARGLASYENFASAGTLTVGEKIREKYQGTADYNGGMMQCAKEYGVELVPTISCLAAAPRLSMDCVERMQKQITDVLEAYRNEIDGICIGLHGAGCAEGIDDLETYTLTALRKIAGRDMPIMVTLDLHANISRGMVELSDGLFGIKHYPHVDMYEAGYLAMKTLIETIRTGEKPEMSFVRLPILLSTGSGYTFGPPFDRIHQFFDDYKEKYNLIDITLFHGFPFSDTRDTAVSIVVVGADAKRHCQYLAQYIWKMKEEFRIQTLTPTEALNRAREVEKEGYIVINEFSDNPGGGTPGDGTHLLREMLRQNLPKSIFGYIYDPEAVKYLMTKKIGDQVSFLLGGRTEPVHGEPLEIKNAKIINMSDGEVVYISPVHQNVADTIGQCVRVRVENVDIIIGSVLHQTYDDRPFLVTGADVNQYRYVGLKSAHHFRAFFASRAARIIPADPPGLQSADLTRYRFEKVVRPIFPLDNNVSFS